LGVAEAGNLKLDFMANKSIGIHFFGLNTFLDVIQIPKPQKPCTRLDTLTGARYVCFVAYMVLLLP